MEAGHGGAPGRFDRLKEVALVYAFGIMRWQAFLRSRIGIMPAQAHDAGRRSVKLFDETLRTRAAAGVGSSTFMPFRLVQRAWRSSRAWSAPLMHRFGDLARIVRVDDERSGQARRGAGEARQDEHAGIFRILRRDIFLGDQVHAVAKRRHQADG